MSQGFTSLTFQCHFYYMREINGLVFEEKHRSIPRAENTLSECDHRDASASLSLGNWFCWCELMRCTILFVCLFALLLRKLD